MNSQTLRLTQENRQLKTQLAESQAALKKAEMRSSELEAELAWVKSQMTLAKKRMYGKSSEKVNYDQLSFFDEAELSADPEVEEPDLDKIETVDEAKVSDIKKKRKRATRKIKCVSRTEYHDIRDELKEKYGDRLRLITAEGDERDELIYHEPWMEKITHKRMVYMVMDEVDENGKPVILKGDMPDPLIDRSYVSPELLANIISEKYAYSKPLYRQQKSLEDLGVPINRQTMSNWILKSHELYFKSLTDYMYDVQINELDYIMADETTVQVLREPGKEASSKSYMWAYMSGRSESKQFILYDYEIDRRYERAEKYLKGFSGTVGSDGYGAYSGLEGVINARDWTHVRRKFQEVIDSAPKGSDIKNTFSYRLRGIISKLFYIEKRLDPSKMTYDEIKEARQKKSAPIVDQFFKEIKETLPSIMPETRLAKACAYALSFEEDLRRYLDDGRIDITTNAIERKMKAFAVGRKNWLFANTPEGAEVSASIYSLVESAKMNNLIPERYIAYILRKLIGMDTSDKEALESIMPWADLPKELYR